MASETETLNNASLNAEPDGAVVLHVADSGDAVVVPGGGWLLSADFDRAGPDLVLTGRDGETIIVKDYFASDTPPDLQTDQGAVIGADLASRLAGPVAPGQFAQAVPTVGAEPIGTVAAVEGTVTITRATGVKVTVDKDTPIFQGDTVETGKGGAIGITFVDDSTFSLGDEGRMVIDEMVYDPGTQEGAFSANLVQGVFSFVSGQIAKTAPDGMVVTTPVATIGIRGTKVAGQAAQEGQENTIALMPETDAQGNQIVGELTVSNAAGTVTLNQAGATVAVSSAFQPPPSPVIVPVAQLEAQFGAALNSLPPSPAQPQDDNGDGGDGDGEQTADGEGGDGEQTAAGEGEGEPGDGEAPPEGEGEPLAEGEGDPLDGEALPEGEGEPLAEGEGEPIDGEALPEGEAGPVEGEQLADAGDVPLGADDTGPIGDDTGPIGGDTGVIDGGAGTINDGAQFDGGGDPFGGGGDLFGGGGDLFGGDGGLIDTGGNLGGLDGGGDILGDSGGGLLDGGDGIIDDFGYIPPDDTIIIDTTTEDPTVVPQDTVLFGETFYATAADDFFIGNTENTEYVYNQAQGGVTLSGGGAFAGGSSDVILDDGGISDRLTFGSLDDVLVKASYVDATTIDFGIYTNTGSTTVGTALSTISVETTVEDIEASADTFSSPGSGSAVLTGAMDLLSGETAYISAGTDATGDIIDLSGDANAVGALIFGKGGADTVTGSVGDDVMYGGTGNDTLNGLGDNGSGNILLGGDGNDTLLMTVDGASNVMTGGLGTDTVDLSGLTSAITAAVGESSTSVTTGGSGSATISSAEIIKGSGTAVSTFTLTGDVDLAGITSLVGGSGNDSFSLNGGSAYSGTLDGGAGTDTLYLDPTANFTGTLTSFETLALKGSTGADTFSTTDFATTVGGLSISSATGGDGADTISIADGMAVTVSGDAGNDVITGGTGSDTARYSGNMADFTLSLSTSTAGSLTATDGNTGDGLDEGTDTLSSIENLSFADGTLTLSSGGMGEQQVNTVTTGDQTYSKVVGTSDGGYVIYWNDASSGFDDVVAQRYNALGVKEGSAFTVNTSTTGTQSTSDYEIGQPLSNGGFVVTWHDNTADGSSWSSWARIYDASGQDVSGAFQLNSTVTGEQAHPNYMEMANGDLMFVWQDQYLDASGYAVIGRRFNADGTAQGAEFQVNTTTTLGQYQPAIAKLGTDGFAVVWADGSSGTYDVVVQRYDSTGTKVGSETTVNTYTTGNQYYPTISTLSDGSVVIGWYDENGQDGSSGGAYARVMDATGAFTTTELQVHTSTTAGQGNAVVAGLDGGGFVATWHSSHTGDSNIYGQVFNAAGTKVGGEFLINVTTTDNQGHPEVAALKDGGFIVTWQSNLQDGSGFGVYSQRFDASGNTVDAQTITGTSGNDTIKLASGSEAVVDGATGTDTVDLSAGVTDVTNAVSIANVENVTGGAGDDIIAVTATSANLTVSGGAGTDRLDLNVSGNGIYASDVEYIYGADGNDIIAVTGTTGATIYGATGDDNLTGGDGADSIYGGAGTDHIYGSAGNDFIDMGTGSDVLGYDNLAGTITITSTGTNTYTAVHSGGWTDTISNAEGLYGTSGNDTFVISHTAATQNLNGSTGTDTVDFSSATGAVVAALDSTTITIGGTNAGTLTAIENMTGSAYVDTLTGSTADNVIDGGAGDDTIAGGSGVDTLIGGAGADNIDGGIGGDTLYGGAGNDSIKAGAAADTVYGGAGNDTIDGQESVTPYGNDVFYGGSSNSDGTADSNDAVTYATVTSTVTVTLGDESGSVAGTATGTNIGTDTLYGIDDVYTGSGADTITGNSGANHIDGGSLNDTITGGGGADTLIGGAGDDIFHMDETTASNDVVYGGTTATDGTTNTGDSLYYQSTTDDLTAYLGDEGGSIGGSVTSTSVGTDTIYGIDKIFAGSGNDTIYGNSADNQIDGGSGNDVIYGGQGNDWIDGVGGFDTVRYDGTSGLYAVTGAVTVTQDTSIHAAVTDGTFTDAVYQHDYLVGSVYNDTFTVTAANAVTFDGAGGTDTLNLSSESLAVVADLSTGSLTVGGSGYGALANIEDVISGSGADTLTGDANVNTLTGGGGADNLTGGTGSDVYRYTSVTDSINGASDTIFGFDAADSAEDILFDVSSGLSISWLGAHSGATFTSASSAIQVSFDDATNTLYADVNDDGTAETEIVLDGITIASGLDATDFSAT